MQTKQIFKDHLLDAILVTKAENLFYMTGFNGSFGQIILTPKKKYFITDPRYTGAVSKIKKLGFECLLTTDLKSDLTEIFSENRITKLGFESTNFTYQQYLNFKKNFKKIKLIPISNEIDQLRMVKTEAEIKLLKKSQEINELTLKKGLLKLKPGISEQQFATEIIKIGLSLGAQEVSFSPIVAFGKNSSSPHYTPGSTKYKKSDLVLIDMGFKLNGYCSDMTRTFLPENPPTQMQEHYNLVLEAQLNCLNKLKAGILASKADEFSRSIFRKANLDEYFTHANGHGVGLEIHESPSLSQKAKHTDRQIKLKENMVVTVEPGIYLPNQYGIRIEDMAVIKPKGHQNLTSFKK